MTKKFGAVTAVGLLVLSACGAPQPEVGGAASPISKTTASTSQAASPAPSTTPGGTQAPSPAQFGPDGVGLLRLGMSREAVTATGQANTDVRGLVAGCFSVEYTDPSFLPPTSNGHVSQSNGLEQVYATSRMTTREGVSIGSTIETVSNAYDRPRLSPGDYISVPMSTKSVLRLQLGTDGRVEVMSLELRDGMSCEA